ncbi:site-specific integrase [Mesorhizobium sp.]|uniref:tyrosine-type recombinase/integrase n=1 Tax=Mesorhizobium sp. TaxID=1871066 RepID=UPI000FEA698D|nr:site-specific integrase [Mesorhizobium sp.]RWN58452.1 MAG: site-specific integrase [Mesorhizobium sp.]
MPKLELTDRFCQTAKAVSGSQTEYFDTIVKGLSLIASEGGSKTFYLHFTKPADGKRARMKIGRYGEGNPKLTLGRARDKAKSARGGIGEGTDPLAEKRAHAASQTVSDMVENYITRRASSRRSVDEIARRLRKNVSGYDADGKKIDKASSGCIGDVKLADLHRRDITRAIDAVKDRGAVVEANRVFEDVRAMVRWARGRGDLDQNLVEGMAKPTETTERDRVLTTDEIKTMWTTLPDADMRESTRRILRLCLITGQRVGEIAGMTCKELDLDRREWIIPAARVKNKREHVVPLSDMAVEIVRDQIADVKALSERKGRAFPPFVFPGPGASAAVTAASIPKAVKREEVTKRGSMTIIGIAPWTPHDLRRSAATGMEEIGVSPFIVGHVLNHVSATKSTITSRVYARYDYAKEKREALDLWADRLSGIVAKAAKIIPMRTAR